MADDKTTKTPEQPVTDSGPGKETPPAPPKEPEKVSVSPEPEKKTEPEVKNPQVSVYNFAEIMKEKKAEERAAAPGVEKPDPAKAEKPEKQPEAPKKAEEKPKEPEQPKRRGRPPKADKDKAAAPKSKAPAQKPEKAVKKEPEKKAAPTVQAASAPKGPEKPKDAPRRGKEQIVYIVLAVFDVSQHVIQQSAGIIQNGTEITPDVLDSLRTELEAMELGPLFGLWLQSFLIQLTMIALNIVIFVIVYGRMIEIYLLTSLAPIPFATVPNRETGHMGQNYFRSLFAVGFQGLLILVCVAIYAVLIQSIATDGDPIGAIWGCVGYTVLLCFTLFKTGSLAKSIFGCH